MQNLHELTTTRQPLAMHDAHGYVPACAVATPALRCYCNAMKSPPYRHAGSHPFASRSSLETRSASERAMPASHVRGSPIIPFRRYPSLSDDGQPYFPRLRRSRHVVEESTHGNNAAAANDHTPFLSVRLIALLAIVLIIVVLAAAA